MVVVNLLAWLMGYYGGITVTFMSRFALIMGIMFITAIFTGAALILGFLDTEERNEPPE